MKKHLRLNEVFPDWLTGDGIFHYIQNNTSIPWSDPDISGTLDITYHGDHGERLISPLVSKLLNDDLELTAANKQKLADVITTLFLPQWKHTYALLSVEYDPLSNYDMEEHETPAEITRTISPAEITETIAPAETTETIAPAETTETITPAETTVESKPAKTVTETGISGFNSDSYSDSDISTVTGDDQDKGESSISVDTAGSNKLQVDTAGSNKLQVDTAGSNKLKVDTAGEDVLTVQNERTLTRKGNIGVTTSQQMAQSEIDLWQWNFYRSVFKDIDSVLTLKIY